MLAVIWLAERRVPLAGYIAVVLEDEGGVPAMGIDDFGEKEMDRAEQAVSGHERPVGAVVLRGLEQETRCLRLSPRRTGRAPGAVRDGDDGRRCHACVERVEDVLAPCGHLGGQGCRFVCADVFQRLADALQAKVGISIQHELVERVDGIGDLAFYHPVAAAAEFFAEVPPPPVHQISTRLEDLRFHPLEPLPVASVTVIFTD